MKCYFKSQFRNVFCSVRLLLNYSRKLSLLSFGTGKQPHDVITPCVCVCVCVLCPSLSNLKQPTNFHHLEYRFNAITNDPSVCNFQFPAIGNKKTEDTRNYEVGVVFKNMKICQRYIFFFLLFFFRNVNDEHAGCIKSTLQFRLHRSNQYTVTYYR
jgi:hypothetical protein